MSRIQETSPPPGRPVRLVPTPPGLWPLVLGVCLAAFAPLFGFLIGSGMGAPDPEVLVLPLYWGLLLGILLGGVGVVAAIIGGWRLWKHVHQRDVAAETDPEDRP